MNKNLILSVAILATLVSTGAQADTTPQADNKTLASFIDIRVFAKACFKFDTVDSILKKNGDEGLALICQVPDGGSVKISLVGDEGTIVIHPSLQMNGDAITNLSNSFQECGEKLIPAGAAGDAGNYGDVKIAFNSHTLSATCSDTPSNPIKAGLKALESFLTKQSQ